VTVVDETPAEFGIKSVELQVEGLHAYGYLRGEKGTHKLDIKQKLLVVQVEQVLANLQSIKGEHLRAADTQLRVRAVQAGEGHPVWRAEQ
jgi:protein subunit release factor B